MKKNKHPKWNSNASVLVSGKKVMQVGSTTDEINVEIWSGNHPFYTGQETIVDTERRVDKFQKKLEAASKTTSLNKSSKRKRLREKRRKGDTTEENLTLKDMLKSLN